MNLTIRQNINITVNNSEKQFLFVKRKLGGKVISQFYQNDSLVLESSLYTIFLRQTIDITYQNLPHFVSFQRTRGWYYSLLFEETILSLKVKYFRRPTFRLLKDGVEIATLENPKLIAIESRYYEMNTSTEDETINLYLMILFLAQLRGF